MWNLTNLKDYLNIFVKLKGSEEVFRQKSTCLYNNEFKIKDNLVDYIQFSIKHSKNCLLNVQK